MKFYNIWSDPDPNLFESFSAPEPDLDLNGHESQDTYSKKGGSYPQHCLMLSQPRLKWR